MFGKWRVVGDTNREANVIREAPAKCVCSCIHYLIKPALLYLQELHLITCPQRDELLLKKIMSARDSNTIKL